MRNHQTSRKPKPFVTKTDLSNIGAKQGIGSKLNETLSQVEA